MRLQEEVPRRLQYRPLSGNLPVKVLIPDRPSPSRAFNHCELCGFLPHIYWVCLKSAHTVLLCQEEENSEEGREKLSRATQSVFES